MTDHPEIAAIRRKLDGRKDIKLDPRNPSPPKGAPPLTGVQIRRTRETHTLGADSFHPHTYVGWLYYGQAFAVDRKQGRGESRKFTAAQKAWKEDFEAVGGVYLEPHEVELAYPDGLGTEPKDIDSHLSRESNRMPIHLKDR